MKELYKSLQDFQAECPAFIKDTDGYGYKYTTLPDIMKVVTPLLKKHGLLLWQRSISSESMIGVESHLVHIESEKELTSLLTMPVVELKSMNLYQAAGSAITYIRRYDMSNLLGLQSEKDDDAGSGKQTVKPYAATTSKKPYTASKNAEDIKRPNLSPDLDNWQLAIEFVTKGGDINAIKNNYNISDNDLKTLVNVKKLTDLQTR